jgi:Flp pilus assembly protein TadB
MTNKKDEKENPMRNPLAWLLNAALLVLGIAIALQVAIALLAEIWVWLVVIGLVVGAVVVWVRLASWRRRQW